MIPKYLVIHHSATDQSVTFEMIRAHHLERGWDDIGYHFVIDTHGNVKMGRAEDVVGAHALGINQESLGICCLGNFELTVPEHEQTKALVELLTSLARKHNIAKENIIGHCDVTCAERDHKRSACPGKHLYGLLGDIRLKVGKEVMGKP